MASDILETNRDRKNRKNAEKINIRVEGSSSGECDGSWNRIAVSSAKCKGNKARWNFYQGQASSILTTESGSMPNSVQKTVPFNLQNDIQLSSLKLGFRENF